ncbi:hypothetical protein AB1Y20_008689 [Prymnesium parvum]|uniref:Uncharacterized protein n=1 Tax=Prymnesium parvum TaxID=97485 RepID=A0AB34IS84_PRYPA|mmetsp:Transcript_32411/g.74249  ORF Transcript_32411/g.74249 Transcript_32411/m.74249 type:complete len:217 (-) Transcript_32411:277-927(-)
MGCGGSKAPLAREYKLPEAKAVSKTLIARETSTYYGETLTKNAVQIKDKDDKLAFYTIKPTEKKLRAARTTYYFDAVGTKVSMSRQKSKDTTVVYRPKASFFGQRNEWVDVDTGGALYLFAEVTTKSGWEECGSYGIYLKSSFEVETLYIASAVPSTTPTMLVTTPEGDLVAKIEGSDCTGSKFTIEVAQGVDIAAVFTLVSASVAAGPFGLLASF